MNIDLFYLADGLKCHVQSTSIEGALSQIFLELKYSGLVNYPIISKAEIWLNGLVVLRQSEIETMAGEYRSNRETLETLAKRVKAS